MRKAILRTKPDTVLEVGCGSGRIYERLIHDGMTARYTGVEMADSVPCGEIAMCSRVGRWGRLSDDGPRQHNSNQSEDPWAEDDPTSTTVRDRSACAQGGIRYPKATFASSSSRSFNTSRGRARTVPSVEIRN